MEETNSSASPRKVKFKPKAPPRKKPHSISPKTEVEEDAGAAAEAELLLRRFKENLGKQGNKVPKNSSTEVAFEQGVGSSTPVQTYGVVRNERNGPSTSKLRSSGTGNKGAWSSLPPTPKEDSLAICSDLSDGVPPKMKEYREPWDYEHTYYPTSLPLRPPYSGDPEILDEAEFGEAARNKEYDESSINPASELGLLDESEEERILFFQLPPKLPIVKRPANIKGKEIIDASSSSKASRSTGQCNLEDLPEGYMGKLQVYKSGKIKLKLGENLYDVSRGLDRIFQENVAAVNASDRKFCVLGDIEKRAIVTPDIDSVLDTFIDLD